MVVKIVHDELVETLGAESVPVDLNAPAPVALMMVGLQGSGKTTTTAKLAKRFSERLKKKVLMASLDTRRPAAQEQLRVLGEQVGVATLPIVAGQTPVEIAKRAMNAGRLGGYDVVMLDTAGRTHIDEPLMLEMAEIEAATDPHEILLVADSLTGQDAVNVARSFNERVGVTGIVLTRVDGDGRGGAALSMRAVTGQPIKLIGTGEKMDALEDFHPGRIADRILGMGDIVSLVERAAENIDAEKAQRRGAKMKKGEFDLEDLADQLRQMQKIGGMSGILGMMPGIGKMKKQLAAAGLDDKVVPRQLAIISSMTTDGAEQAGADECEPQAARRLRLRHRGAGRQQAPENAPADVGHDEEDRPRPRAGSARSSAWAESMPQPDPAMLEQIQKGGLGGLPGGLPGGMGGGIGGLPPFPGGMPKLPGMGGGFSGLPDWERRNDARTARPSPLVGEGVVRLCRTTDEGVLALSVRTPHPSFRDAKRHVSHMTRGSERIPISLKGPLEWQSKSDWPGAAPRSAPISASSSPTSGRRATAASSRRSGPTIRSSPPTTRSASSSTSSASSTGSRRARSRPTACSASSTRPAC